MYDRILVPTDGSSMVDQTLEHALSLATSEDATIHAVYVVDTRITRSADQSMQDELESKLEAEGSTAISTVLDRVTAAGIEATGEILSGSPSTKIVDYAQEKNIDLIIIGPTGKTPREKVTSLGSVSERVVSDATVPVLLARPTSPEA